MFIAVVRTSKNEERQKHTIVIMRRSRLILCCLGRMLFVSYLRARRPAIWRTVDLRSAIVQSLSLLPSNVQVKV